MAETKEVISQHVEENRISSDDSLGKAEEQPLPAQTWTPEEERKLVSVRLCVLLPLLIS